MDNYAKAYLDLISYCEGTYGKSNNGYDVLFSSKPNELRIIQNWTENTNIVHGNEKWRVKIGNNLYTTAAGRYQFIGSSWIEINNGVNSPLTKKNQDNACLNLSKKKLGNGFNFNIVSEKEMDDIRLKLLKTWSSFNKFKANELLILYKQAYNKY